MSRDKTDVAERSTLERGPEQEWEKSGVEGGGLRDTNIVDFDGPNDPEHPLNWSTTRKTTSIVIVSLTPLLSPVGSTISAAAAADIMQHFGTSDEMLGTLVTTIYLLGYAFGPMVIAPLSELYGRAIVFRSCTLLFVVFNVACAVANSFGSLVVYRLLAGIAGSCAGTLGASSIADMIAREKRGTVMSAYIMGPTLGPTIGPIIGGNITAAAGWRWGFWLMAIASLSSSSSPYTSRNHNLRSALDTSKNPSQLFAFSILRPFKMLVSPIVFLMSAYAATVFSYAYLCFTTFPRIFKDQYGFGSGASGLTSIGIGVGFIVGLLFVGAVSRDLSDRWSAHLTNENGGVAKPEYRLPIFVVGAVFVPIGLFWYGWSAEYKAHWIVPIIGTAFTGIGIVTAYTTTATYLIDAYTVFSASVMAASAILRCLFGALLPLAGSAMFDALG
ncbi:MFS transporter prlG, partial [Colletotrichum shisoi]